MTFYYNVTTVSLRQSQQTASLSDGSFIWRKTHEYIFLFSLK